jgi:hypothetical protein
MHRFEFTLQLPGGDTITAHAVALRWQWTQAFAQACRTVEERTGLPPYAGITCQAVTVHPLDQHLAA